MAHQHDTASASPEELPPEPLAHCESPAPSKPLLEQSTELPKGWPESPRAVESSWPSILSDLAVDVVLLALSLGFLAFGLAVRFFDQVPTKHHPRTADALVEATKYVGIPNAGQ